MNINNQIYLVTGCAGFIGMHTCLRILNEGNQVVGIDNLNDYYDVNLKKSRLFLLSKFSNFKYYQIDINESFKLRAIFDEYNPQIIIHLAAQAGVRYSLINPLAYINSNINAFVNLLENCRHNNVKHFIYASSSSVYGGNTKIPFSEHDNVDHPVSLYAATKKSNELIAHSYSHLFNIPTTGLRFFTVYGPWGRPDMALFIFTKAILENRKIDIFNNGNMIRDFTFIDDIIESLFLVANKPATPNTLYNSLYPDPATSSSPFRIFNIGNGNPIQLSKYINAIENKLGIISDKNYLEMQPGDVLCTSANTDELFKWIEYRPQTSIKDGISEFVDWYKNYYKI
jgi:UDP-glucuronate 4-epimerase